MCPGIAVLGGGGAGGDGDGDGSGGKDGAGGDGSGKGKNGANDGKNADGAPDYAKYPECGYASHPVDVVTGRAFTHPITDLELPGPMPFAFARMYSSKMADRDVGLGFGWAHSFGWEIQIGRLETVVWNEQGIAVRFAKLALGAEQIGPWGWLLRRSEAGFWLDVDDGVFRRFEPADEAGRRFRLASVEDRNGNRISLRYDGARLEEIEDSVGRVVRVRGTKEGRIAAIEAKNAIAQGQWVAFGTYAYDDRGNLVSATDADGYAARYAYDEDHRLTADTDRTGLTFHFVYDREGRCVESWGDYPGKRDPSLAEDLPKMLADGITRAKGIHHCRFDYMPGGYSEVADSTQVRRFFGNAHGTLDKSVVGGGVMTATYRDDGHILARMDAVGAITKYERDPRGRLLSVTDPLGGVTRIERDGNGLPVVITNAAGGVTRIERDSRGNALLVTDALGGTTLWRYDERGLPVERVSATGARTTFGYDAHANLERASLPNGGVFRFAYDGLSRQLSRTDPLSGDTRRAYSTGGRIIATRDELGGVFRYTYDGEGHITQISNPSGHTTRFTWGGYHKLCERTDANGGLVRLRWSVEGELLEVHNEHGEAHRFMYNASGTLCEEVTFDGRRSRYRCDPAGRIIKTWRDGLHISNFEYDLSGRLVKREVDGRPTETFVYDALDNLVEATSAASVSRFERDALSRVVREVQITGGEEHWTADRYDAAGARTRRRTSFGHVEEITRGALGERTRTVLDSQLTVDHFADLLGQEVARTLPNGGRLETEYDAMGRITRRRALRDTHPGLDLQGQLHGRVSVDTSYHYDEAGRLVASWDHARGHSKYDYDPAGHLLTVTPERGSAEYFAYDPAGNLYEADDPTSVRVYEPGGRLARKGDTTYHWSPSGRLCKKVTPDGVWLFTWDGGGSLMRVERPDGLRIDFEYDALARRVSKRVTQKAASTLEHVEISSTRFVWAGDVLIHEIENRAIDGGGELVEERTYCFEDKGFAPVAHRQRTVDDSNSRDEWLHFLNDAIGTPERLVSGDGTVACDLTRKAWGATETLSDGQATTALRFLGQYADEETGLAYNRHRYYDPSIGSYISPDPLGLQGGLRAYGYARTPLQEADPLGLIKYRRQDYSAGYDAARRTVLQRDQTCQYCQAAPATSADHVTSVHAADAVVGAGMMTQPEAAAAVNNPAQMLGACGPCNSSKQAKDAGNVPGTWQPPNPTPQAIDAMRETGNWQDP
jgi:RHS repeat-associated protein